MRIAIVTATFPPYNGGMGAAAQEQAAAFGCLGHEVTVFAPGDKSSDTGALFRVQRLRPLFRIGNGAVLPQLMWRLRGFDLVVLHYPSFGLLTPIFLWRKIWGLRKKFAVTYHMDPIAQGVRGMIFAFSQMTIARVLLRSADKIVVSTLDYAKHSSLTRFGVLEKCVEIPFLVDTEYFSPASVEEKEDFRKMYTSKNVLFIGGMDTPHDFKGVPELLHAWSESQVSDATLHLVGDGNLRSSYEQLATSLNLQSHVRFYGAASKDEVKILLRNADLLVLPSKTRSEAFGIVLLEAMSSGTAVIASNLPGVRTVVQEQETGWLVKPGDVQELALVFKDALGDVKRLSQMGERARERAVSVYSKKNFEERATAFLDSLLVTRV